MMSVSTASANAKDYFPTYAAAHGDISEFDVQLLEEYALDDDMDLDLFADPADGTKRTLTMSEMEDETTDASASSLGSGGRASSTVSSVTTASSTQGTKKRKTDAPRKKSEEQMERRRERNRILARRTRLRKKFFFESLQKQVMDLKRENTLLKDVVRTRMSDAAPELLAKYNTQIPSIVAESMAEATSLLEKTDFNLVKALQTAQQSFVVTDPSLPDNPIVFASQGFLEITGYRMDQVLGRNCRFLQGPETDQSKVDSIRKGIAEGTDTSVCLKNYRADGTPFWNQFFVAPLRDLNHNVVYYVGAQCVIDKPIDEKED